MQLLLDTHVIIWFIEVDPKLSNQARLAIRNPANGIFVSVVSLWEMAIKVNLGKLNLPKSVPDITAELQDMGIYFLPIYEEHAMSAGMLPLHHRDPFDRMLIAQANWEQLTLVTRDEIFQRYDVPLIW